MNHASSHSDQPSTPHEQSKVAGKMKDPVCGMDVDVARAAGSRELAGQTFYFCGAGCASKFDADPARYAKASEKGHSGSGCCG